MTAAQIADTRERLSITLESAEGSGEVPAPIESFDDMVSCPTQCPKGPEDLLCRLLSPGRCLGVGV